MSSSYDVHGDTYSTPPTPTPRASLPPSTPLSQSRGPSPSPTYKKRSRVSTTKKILVIGATGRQGTSVVHHLRPSVADSADFHMPYHVLALTRKPSGKVARELSEYDYVTVVEGDLDRMESVRRIFEDAKANTGGDSSVSDEGDDAGAGGGGIWGVFVALEFPGLGADAEAEERHGKQLADLAHEFGVKCFIYSSVERGGEGNDDRYTLDRAAKVAIERHTKKLGQGEKGLNWTILRPGFFMENFEGAIGAITTGVLKAGLQPGTAIQLIAVDDLGKIAAGIFKDPPQFRHKILVGVSDPLTMGEQEEAYKLATGKSRPTIPAFVARGLISMNSHTRDLMADCERVYAVNRDSAENTERLQLSQRAASLISTTLTSFHAWAAASVAPPVPSKRDSHSSGMVTIEGKKPRAKGWNGVTVSKLMTGKQ